MQEINIVFQIFILVFSVIIHEVSHGLMAYIFGDKTAEYEGRLTLNPIKHIDLYGSIILPIFLWLVKAGFMIGWAKPVPYNPYNLKHRKIAEPLVAFAGPLSNIIVALFFGLLIRLLGVEFGASIVLIFAFVVLVNISLAVFNLIPLPPLDGSKILFSFIPLGGRFIFSRAAEKYGLLIIIAVVFLAPDIISPIIWSAFKLITGLA